VRAAELADRAAGGRVLVVGSPPPLGRDLDLVALPPERGLIETALREADYVQGRDAWVRFADCTAEVVQFIPLGISDAELDGVLARARSLDGFEQLVAPAPADDLLVLARFQQWGGWKEKRRARLEAAASPEAWTDARRRAPSWGVVQELEQLSSDALVPRRAAPRRPRVVALSGIDGSGKSTQARALRDTLEMLGYDAVVSWTPMSQNAWLGAVAAPVKRVLRALRGGAAPVGQPGTGLHRDEGTELRQKNALVFFGWTLLVALANGLFHLRQSTRHAAAGRVVVFDRYVLDTAAQWGFRYGDGRGFRVQKLVVRLLSPRPVAAFFLDIPADVSLARKPDDRWTDDELRTQERLYRLEAMRHAVTRLDGLRPENELCATIAEHVWRALER
jgi:thymidylate kinase